MSLEDSMLSERRQTEKDQLCDPISTEIEEGPALAVELFTHSVAFGKFSSGL